MMDLLERLIHLVTIETLFVIVAALFGLWVMVAVAIRGADPADLVLGSDGKLSWTNIGSLVGGTSLTYGFLHMVTANTLTEWYFGGYGLLMFGTAYAYKLNAIKAGLTADPPNQQIKIDAPADAQVNVKSGGNQ
jgi:hypothetical protein